MSIGESMIVGAALAAAGAAATRALALRSGYRNLARVSVLFSMLTFLMVTIALVLLTYYFLTSDFTYFYVWSYSSTDLSTVYKLSGVWAGASGSFLFWVWLMALILIAEAVLEPRRAYLGRKFHGVFQVILSSTLVLFLLVLMTMDLFKPTESWALLLAPDGYGMKLVLQTPEMVVHPPVVFAGYAFCVAAFAAGAAYFLTSDKNWPTVSLPWSRLGWLFLTLGIGIGAIWAYYVLGWGGYWAWDPVETSSLLPWLIVTAFLHTQLRHMRKGEYTIVSPLLGMLSFVAVIFATFATRAGGIWSSSVHSFGSSEGASAGERLSYLLQHDNAVLGIFTIMLMFLALSVFLAYSKYRSGPRLPEQPELDKISEYISDKNNMLLTIALLIATSAVMLLLLFKNVDSSSSANYYEFNQKMSLFFVAVMVTMSVCLLWKYLGKDLALRFALGLVAVSIALGILAAATGSFDSLVAFSLPSYLVAVGASVVRLARSVRTGSVRAALQKVSPHMVHLAVALVLISFVVSSNMQQLPDNEGRIATPVGIAVDVGEELTVGDYTLRLLSLDSRSASVYTGGTMVTLVREAVLDIARSGETLRQGVVLSDMYGPASGGGLHVVDVEVFVYKSVSRDLYVNFQWQDNDTALIEAKTIPLMNTLWIGFGLLAVGITLRTVAWRQEPKGAEKKPTPATAEKPGKDYEALVEEELRKFKEKRGK